MIPLEDNHEDIIGKAITGLNLSPKDICEKSGIHADDLKKILAGDTDKEAISKIAPTLNLSIQALLDSAEKKWHPNISSLPAELHTYTTPFDDMTVNSYLIILPKTNRAIAFDTGTDANQMLDLISSENLQLTHIFLTHTHGDHIFELDRMTEKTGAIAHVNVKEKIPGATTFNFGKHFELDSVTIRTLQTTGHSIGGTTYVLEGLSKKLAIVGDAIFAGSMGGGMISYEDALEANQSQILTLPDETLLCPGHGPITQVGLEKQHNPFFATA
ncbi:MAG: MBL fold metallo-hydrolase [Verrucomicrobiota bacterium]